MVERLFITLLLVSVGGGAYLALSRRHARLAGGLVKAAGPALLYFRGAHCSACAAQSHFLEQVERQWSGSLFIEKIDAEAEPERAARYGVFTLPTTMVVDRGGAVRHVNYGLANPAKLVRQLESLS
jgi:thioredoxin-like negative regulator of GroEL